jgi:pimeloyl-ACP methyl ester carboxylesterase
MGPLTDSFHVIIPIPGFGFSGKPKERGSHTERIANVWVKLIARLGYTRYAVHGRDWGWLIAMRMAVNDAMHVAALHLGRPGRLRRRADGSSRSRFTAANSRCSRSSCSRSRSSRLGRRVSQSGA